MVDISSGAYGGGGATFAGIDPGPGNGGRSSGGGGRGGGGIGYGDTNLGFQASLDEKAREANLSAAQAKAELDAKQGRFNSVFGYLQGLGSNFLNSSPFGQAFRAGGSPVGGPEPRIDANPVWNPQQVQQQVNNQRAQNDAGLQSQERQNSQSLAGRGYGANSPLLSAMNQSASNANLIANASADRDTRLNAAQANAGQVLKGQQAQEGQYASRQQEDIQRRQPYVSGWFNTRNALLGALSGLA